MAKYRFNARLTKDSIDNLIKELNNYKDNILPNKTKLFVERLAEQGIYIAKENLGILDDLGNVGYLVKVYQVPREIDKTHYQTIMYACDTSVLLKSWITLDGVHTAEVSPILMYEFGSGQNALNPLGISGVGQGTFPGQTHANNPSGWSWQDLNGDWHHSKGIHPTQPMYKAFIEMQNTYKQIAREVFG